jgi:hypothetical protein
MFGNVDMLALGSLIGREVPTDQFAESSYETTHLFVDLAPGRSGIGDFDG